MKYAMKWGRIDPVSSQFNLIGDLDPLDSKGEG